MDWTKNLFDKTLQRYFAILLLCSPAWYQRCKPAS